MLKNAPSGLAEIKRVFGNADATDFESKNIVLFDLPYTMLYDGNPIKRSRCHRLLVDNFKAVFQDIKDAGLTGEVMNFAGIYNKRPIRGKSNPSTHCWGISIDVEPDKYPLGSSNRFSDSIIELFEKHGFFYGGNFMGRKDPMHFQFATNY